MTTYPTATIRRFLREHFDDSELTDLCFDYFLNVYHNFTVGMSKGQKIQLLLEDCQKHGRYPDLLATLQKERPTQYDTFFPDRPQVETPPIQTVERNPRQIFLSYAHQDAEFAQRLAGDLEAQGWPVWIAPNSIRPGEKWLEAIGRGLDESGIFILVLTPTAVASRWVRDETNVAIELEKEGKVRFLPLRVKWAEVPTLWRVYQHISFENDYEDGLQKLLTELQPGMKVETFPSPSLYDQLRKFAAQAGLPVWSWWMAVLVVVGLLGWGISQILDGSDTTPPATRMADIPEFTPMPTGSDTTPPATEMIDVPTPTPIPTGLIAFSSSRHADRDIYVMKADGTGVSQLTNSAGDDNRPNWSLDGTQIAFDSERDGNWEIYVINDNGSGATNLTNHPAHELRPDWSPGSEIAFESNRDGNTDIFVMNADGSGVTQLTSNTASDSCPDWSPDGTQIAFDSDRDGNRDIYIMNADGSSQINITNHTSSNHCPTWSPDGTLIAFRSDRDGDDEIYVMNANGSGVRQLTRNSVPDWSPASWSPDGYWLAFLSLDGNWEIYLTNLEGSEQINLTNTLAYDAYPAWLPVFDN